MKSLTSLPAGVVDVARHGSWWCRRCQRFVGLDVDGEQSRCAVCRSVHIKYCPAVRNQAAPRGQALGPVKPLDQNVARDRAHGLFEVMRKNL